MGPYWVRGLSYVASLIVTLGHTSAYDQGLAHVSPAFSKILGICFFTLKKPAVA